jgi:hypothetical protein
MVFLLALIFWCCFAQPSHAQDIPLYYQLLFAFRPASLSLSSLADTPLPTPSIPLGDVLGISDVSEKPVVIAVLGDSMIDTLGASIPALQKALQNLYPKRKFKIINYGVGASHIEYAYFRLTHDYDYRDQHYPSLLSHKPDLIIIESFAYNNFGNSQTGLDRQWQALSNITSTIKNQLPQTKILLATTIAPNSVSFSNGIDGIHLNSFEKIERTSTIKLYLQNLINFANSQKYPLADAYHPSLSGQEGNKNYISSADNLHPSSEGGQFFCRLLAQSIFDNNLIQ